MHAPHRQLLRGIGLLVGMGALAVASLGQTYRTIDLGSLHELAEARAVNNSLAVAGSTVGGRGNYRGFVWDTTMTAVTPPRPLTQAEGMDINAVSRAVFAAYSLGDVATRATLRSPGGVVDLGEFCPRAINRSGSVVGARDAVDPGTGLVTTQAVLWRRGTLQALPHLNGGMFSMAFDVSNGGMIVGSALGADAPAPTAVVWRGGSISELGTLGRTPAQATCVSPNGLYIAGFSATATDPLHAFRYKVRGGSVVRRRDLGTLVAGGWSIAYDVNNAGQVVGTSGGRAFLHSKGSMIDLNTRIQPGLDWTLIGATGINQRGDIVGWGRHGVHGLRAFLLVSVCSPADIAEPFGVLDSSDRDLYLAHYAAAHLSEADLTGSTMPGVPAYGVPDGILSNDDLVYFLSLYAAGC